MKPAIVFVVGVAAFLLTRPVVAESCDVSTWELETTSASGARVSLEDFDKDRVLIIFYEGQRTKNTNRAAKKALEADDAIGTGGKLLPYVGYFGIANYKEIWAPQWLVSKFLARRMKKHNVMILEDRDRCFSSTGASKRCLEGKRKPYFTKKKANIGVLYDRALLHHFSGKVEPDRLVRYIRTVGEAARDDRDFCWVQENVEY